MGKRSQGQFARNIHDLYDTVDPRPVRYLLPFLPDPSTFFIEPCVGNGELEKHLRAAGHFCVFRSDVTSYPQPDGAMLWHADATKALYGPVTEAADCFITNPPWTRSILHPLIENLSNQLPTWLLFDSDWMHRATTPKPLLDRCSHIVAAGRVRWMMGKPEDRGHDPKDNVCWYRFDAAHRDGPRFYGRGE